MKCAPSGSVICPIITANIQRMAMQNDPVPAPATSLRGAHIGDPALPAILERETARLEELIALRAELEVAERATES